jgi:hypothetical protein
MLATGGRLAQEGTLAMLRNLSLLAILLAANLFATGGCQSCSSCHDYDPPVADCNCSPCCRSGSASCGGGMVGGDCATGGCNCGGGPAMQGDMVEGPYEEMSQ